MKKVLSALLMLAMAFTLAACEDEVELGDYKPGLHLGYTEGNENTFAYVYVDSKGFIQDVHIDSVYAKSVDDGPVWAMGDESDTYNATTKRSLNDGLGYGMNDGEEALHWFEQADAFGDDVVENQMVPDYSLTDGKLDDDAITGVTVTVTGFITAVENALERAALGTDEVPTDFDVPEFDSEGDYTPGIQYGYSDGNMNGHAFLAVNEDGNIEYAAIDVVYMESTDDADAEYATLSHGSTKTGILTTKMSLDYGTGYGMHRDDDGNVVEGEMAWEEQMQALADTVVENQGNPDDTVAGVSITISHVITALEMALGR